MGSAGRHPAGHGGSRLVPRSAEWPASAPGRVLLQHQSPRRGGHGQRETGLGALAPPSPDRPGRRVRVDGRPPLRRASRIPPPVVVGGKPIPVGDSLDKRDRARDPADLMGLDPPAARRLGGRPGPVRAERAGPQANLVAPDLPVRVPQPRLVGQQPRRRRGGRTAGGRTGVPLVRGEHRLG